MSFAPGVRLGPSEILSFVGGGGMGEVYRVRYSRLGRDVAIKLLPTALSADSDRLRRFEQEARAAAALNHSNILAVYDVGHTSTLCTVCVPWPKTRSAPLSSARCDELLLIILALRPIARDTTTW